MDMKVSSTIGFERRHNDLLQERDEDRFVARATASLPPQPPNFQAVVDINRGPLQREGVEAHPLTPRQVEQMQAGGALVVDVRTALQFDEAHLPESVSIPAVQAGFGTKLSWVADRAQDVVLIGPRRRGRHPRRTARGGGGHHPHRRLSGRGMTSWREEKRHTDRIERIDVPGLHERLARDPGLQILDVRARAEWEERHIPGSISTPYHDVRGIPDGIDPSSRSR